MAQTTRILLLSIILSSCILDSQLQPVVHPEFLHDGNSKVWILTKQFKGEEEIETGKYEKQTTFTFFKDGDVFMQPRLNLGGYAGKQGKFNINYNEIEKDTSFCFIFQQQRFDFKVLKSSKNYLKIEPTKGNTQFNTLVIKPLDKPF
jgi:hypothetical protein